ncbi:exodeoxyribonuclease VIII [Yokenella regensburgei]|uniref:exodeoxyribonuclease VIII n=1 Tax=Yokenella regensburgei TaxID=158877 RepID=UPI001432ECF8|nr:exodeoxyribonuclease VIII [Yokenella regensburgei]QIU89348.1 exodeoxyribonuclease VIII [Yokenella regensburgei]
MTVELKTFCGALFPKDKALKNGHLDKLAIAVKSKNKTIAEAIITGKLAEFLPENTDDYFKAKVWEDRVGLPRPSVGEFTTDFFETIAIWNAETGEPEAMLIEPEMGEEVTEDAPADKTLPVSGMSSYFQAASLALFGPLLEVTSAQYGQIVDLTIDDEKSPERELYEAITHNPPVLQLYPEKQISLLEWVRGQAKFGAQWTAYSKLIEKWLSTSPKDRPAAAPNVGANDDNRTDSGATLGGKNCTDRSPDMVHNLSTLRLETALGVLASAMDFDIYTIPSEIMRRAKTIEETGNDPRFSAWWTKLRSTPGILDYSRAAIIALIKTAPEDLYRKPIDLREYICRELVETDHAHPSQALIDIACGTVRYSTEKSTNDETKPPVSGEAVTPADDQQNEDDLHKQTDAILATERGEYVPGVSDPDATNWVHEDFGQTASNEVEKTEVTAQEVNRPLMSDREIEIAHALDDLISGRTNVMSKEEAEGVVACTGHPIPDIFPLLIADIAVTECCLLPDFSDEEVHDVGTTILDGWSEDINIRQKIALDAIVECRKPAPSKVQKPKSVNQQLVQKAESVNHAPTDLTWYQQLVVAAVHGMCANPAYSSIHDDIPSMATQLAVSIIHQQEDPQ